MANLCFVHKRATLKTFDGRIGLNNISNNAFSDRVGKIVDKVTNYRVRDSIPKLKGVIWSDYSNEIIYYFHYLGLEAQNFVTFTIFK